MRTWGKRILVFVCLWTLWTLFVNYFVGDYARNLEANIANRTAYSQGVCVVELTDNLLENNERFIWCQMKHEDQNETTNR